MSSARDFYRLLIIAALVFSVTAVSAARTRAAKHTTKSSKVSATTKSARTTKTSVSKSSKSRGSAKSTRASKSSRGKKGKAVAARRSGPRGQQEIASERTREIQSALIRERYLDGEPSGVMDQDTKSALMKLQSDNGWQTRIVPDARALIKLGLGPSRDGLLNPDSAALAAPATLGVEKEIPGGR